MSAGPDYNEMRYYELEGFARGTLVSTGIQVKTGTPVKIDTVKSNPDVIKAFQQYPVNESACVVVHFPFPVPPVDVPYDLVLPVNMDDFVNDAVQAAVQVSEYFQNQCMDIDLVTASETYRLMSATEAHLVIAPSQ